MAEIGFKNHPGYLGAFTRAQAPGALASGARVVKVDADDLARERLWARVAQCLALSM